MAQYCKVKGCNKKSRGLGYCKAHYRHFKKYGDPEYYAVELHGLSKAPEYGSWASMKSRCLNKNAHAYERYGGKEITISPKWINSFETFLKDMGRKPNPSYFIDRIDNTKGYCPDNCRWVSVTDSNRNRSGVKLCIEYAIKIRDLYKTGLFSYSKLSKIYKVPQSTIAKTVHNIIWRVE